LEELARKDQELLEQRKQLFRGIEAERSIYLFSKVSGSLHELTSKTD